MERLSDRDLRAALSFLRETYGQPDLDTFAGRAVERLTAVVGAQRVSYNEMHRNGGTVRALIRPADDSRDSAPGRPATTRCCSASSGPGTGGPTSSPTS